MSTVEGWWEPRREGEPSSEFLGRVLDELGAGDLAANARAFHYDDFLCPDDIGDGMEKIRLVKAVHEWEVAHNHPRRARFLARAIREGEFDSTLEESKAWGESPEGKAAFAGLVAGARRRGRR